MATDRTLFMARRSFFMDGRMVRKGAVARLGHPILKRAGDAFEPLEIEFENKPQTETKSESDTKTDGRSESESKTETKSEPEPKTEAKAEPKKVDTAKAAEKQNVVRRPSSK